jgi:predicted Zn-dependent peptidase
MREARNVISRNGGFPADRYSAFLNDIAQTLDRHAAAQREKDAQIAEDMASYCRRTGAWKTLDEAAAAIRSTP